MSDPCELTISKQTIPGQVEIVSIVIKDGPKTLFQIEIVPTDFLTALLSGQTVMAAIERGQAPKMAGEAQ